MSNITMIPTSNRQKSYAAKVSAFISTHGPRFTLTGVDYDQQGNVCDCCGYHPIKQLFNVKGEDGGNYVIGSECQLFVLGTEGTVPAAKLRTLDYDVLESFAAKLGIEILRTSREGLAEQIVEERRCQAARRAWGHRRTNQQSRQLILTT